MWAWCSLNAEYSTTVFQKSARILFFFLLKFRGGVIIWRIFYYGSILRSSPLMRTFLLAKGWIGLEFLEGFINVSCHWYIYMFLLVIPLDNECRIKFPFPINCDFVKLLHCFNDIICMFLSNTLNSKVINNNCEGYWAGFVVPDSRGEFNRLISVFLQVIFKSFMFNSFRLWQTIHDLSNSNIDFYIVGNISEIIFIDNLLGYDVKGKLYIFVTVHCCV